MPSVAHCTFMALWYLSSTTTTTTIIASVYFSGLRGSVTYHFHILANMHKLSCDQHHLRANSLYTYLVLHCSYLCILSTIFSLLHSGQLTGCLVDCSQSKSYHSIIININNWTSLLVFCCIDLWQSSFYSTTLIVEQTVLVASLFETSFLEIHELVCWFYNATFTKN